MKKKPIICIVILSVVFAFSCFSVFAQYPALPQKALLIKHSGDSIQSIIYEIATDQSKDIKFQVGDENTSVRMQIPQSAVKCLVFDNGETLSFSGEFYNSFYRDVEKRKNLFYASSRYRNFVFSYQRILPSGKIGLAASFVTSFFKEDSYQREYYVNDRPIDYGARLSLYYYLYDGYFASRQVNPYFRFSFDYGRAGVTDVNYIHDSTKYWDVNTFRTSAVYGLIYKPNEYFFLQANIGLAFQLLVNDPDYAYYDKWLDKFNVLLPIEIALGFRL
jgi:hypothetical protein